MRVFIVLAVACLCVAEIQAKVATFDVDDVTYYNCVGKPDGNYIHPYNCNQFITCHNNRASERDCAICHVDPADCPNGRLFYQKKTDTCELFHIAGCVVDGGDETSEEPETERPIEPTSAPPVEGGDCLLNCTHQAGGNCDEFQRCSNSGGSRWDNSSQSFWGKWETVPCGDELFWNPTPPGVSSPGGTCDLIENLPTDLQNQYKSDEACFPPCRFEEHETDAGQCAGQYYYLNRATPNTQTLTKTLMQCPASLVFNIRTETCDRCQNVNGGKCCSSS